jgi:hypothetical protein
VLSEFCCIFLFIVPVIIFILSFSKMIDSRFKEENAMHRAIYSFFMEDKCMSVAKCSDSELRIRGLDNVKVRKPSKGLSNVDEGGTKNDSLDEFYKEFEEKIKTVTRK